MKRATALATLAAPAPERAGDMHCLGGGAFPLDWNGPSDRPFIRFQDEDLERPITELLERIVSRQPDRVAIVDGASTLTYAGLWSGVTGLAEVIAGRTKPGEAVGILLPACAMAPLAMLACLAAGRPFLMLDAHACQDLLAGTLRDAQPALIISESEALEGWDAGPAGVIRISSLPNPATPGWRPAAMSADEPACILFTSGSTGRPKGIVNSQRNLLQRAAQSINAAHINADDRLLTLAALSTIVGVRDVVTALLAGASVRLIDPQRAGPRETRNIIQAEAITILFAFPALLRTLVTAGGQPAPETLRLVRAGGDTLLWSDLDMIRERLAPHARVQLIFAATEAPMMQWFASADFRGADARIPIGYPLPGNHLAILDEHGRPVRPGEFGELVVVSRYVSLGLWQDGRCRPESAGHAAQGSRIFRSGDLVRQRSDGLIERAGRIDRQVKIRGSRVDLDGVEAILRGQPFVEDVGAVARTTGADGSQVLVAYVCVRTGASAGVLDDIKADLRSAPAAMRPSRIHLVQRIPRLRSSKLDTRALLAMDEAHAMEAPDAAIGEHDPISQRVALAWLETLNSPVRGIDDDFFESGGDSLQAIAFTLKLEEALGVELPVTLLNETPSFGALCDALRRGCASTYKALVLLKSGDGSPPVFLIHGVGGNVTEMLPMARRMAYPGPVIGIQARGLCGRDAPHATVEAMAADYLRAIRLRQPEGPYHVCGYSFGGLVAFEIAKRLRGDGDEVGLVGLFDTLRSPVTWPLTAWALIAWRTAGRLLSGRPRQASRIRAPRVMKVMSSALIASARYRPGFYPGSVTLFSAAEREPGLPPIEHIWRNHASAIVTIPTPGAHATMMSGANAEICAAQVSSALARAGKWRGGDTTG